MQHQSTCYIRIGFVISILLLSANLTLGQTTAFTYQGKLEVSGSPAAGNYDFQFRLFDALSGGAQQGATVTLTNISVTNGIFAVTLDFGANFPGANRFLEISVKVAGGPTYTTLTPRQQITSTPYAVKSVNATTADGLSVSCVNCVTSSQIASVNGSAVTGAIPVASVPAGSTNYVQNTISPQAASNFNISGNGTAGGTLSANAVNATTQYNIGGNRVLSIPGSFNLFTGIGAGTNTTAGGNVFVGYIAGQANITGTSNTIVGAFAGQNNTASNNTFVGTSAGLANTTGTDNAFFGVNAGDSNTAGNQNSFFGRFAGSSNTTGNGNNFFGYAAGNANTTGTNNAFFGVGAGQSNTTAGNNAFFGNVAGGNNTTGTFNSFYGSSAGLANTTGSKNSFFGTQAGLNNTGSQNSFFGANAGLANTTAGDNSFFGYNAGNASTGSLNSFFGSNAGGANTTGFQNAFFGKSAGEDNTTGANNAFFGSLSGQANTTGNSNTFFGAFAGNLNTTGFNNVFLGAFAGQSNLSGGSNVFIGQTGGVLNTTGGLNIFIGNNAGDTNTIGSSNTIIGANADVASINLTNASAIGANASVSQSNSLVLGNNANVGIGTSSPADKLHVAGDIRVGTGTTGCVKDADGTLIAGVCSSDLRFKRNITPFPNLLDKVVKLQPVNFFWRSRQFPQYHFGTSQSYGLIAQEVEAIFPDLISTDEQGFKAVNYSKLPLLAIQAIKEQQTQLAQQQRQIKQQQSEIEQLKQLICADHPRAAVCQQK